MKVELFVIILALQSSDQFEGATHSAFRLYTFGLSLFLFTEAHPG